MAYCSGSTMFVRARTPAAERVGTTRPADPAMHWREALEYIGSRGKSYDAFTRYTSEGVIVNGVRVVLGTVPRPGGRRVLVSQAEEFARVCDDMRRIDDRQISKGQSSKAANQTPRPGGLRLVGSFARERSREA